MLKDYDFNFFEENQLIFLYSWLFWSLLLVNVIRKKECYSLEIKLSSFTYSALIFTQEVRESHQLFFDFEQRKKQTNKRPNALFKMIQNMSIRGYYRSIYFPTFFLGGCLAGINDKIISGLLKKYHAFQAESGKNSPQMIPSES